MARRPRIDLAGYHHVINRGVEKRKIFMEESDYAMFLSLLCEACRIFDMKVHSYCLMSNHYHLLLELQQENLSLVMRYINSRYAIYFNKKLKRVGHLWQGRFKSWYVADEAYLYTLIRYIEFNALKAKMVKRLDAYKYSSYRSFIGKDEPIECLKGSLLFKDYENSSDRASFFETSYDKDALALIAKSSRLVSAPLHKNSLSTDTLTKMFQDVKTKSERNSKIDEAIKMGYSQHKIAKALGLTQASISLVAKEFK